MADTPSEAKPGGALPERESFGGKIAAILLRRNMIDIRTLQQVSTEIQADGKRLEECLLERRLVSDTDMTLVLAEYLGLSPMTLAHFTPDSRLLELMSGGRRSGLMAVPVAKTGNTLTSAFWTKSNRRRG